MRRRYSFSAEAPRTRKSESIVIGGWSPIYVLYPKGRRVRYRCPDTTTDLFGRIKRCTFYCVKKKIPMEHSHTYEVEENSNLGLHGADSEKLKGIDDVNERTVGLVAKLALELDLPARRVCGKPMEKFCLALMKIGWDLRQTHCNALWFPAGFRLQSAKVLTRKMREIGLQRKADNLKVMKEIGYINMAVDAGTVSNFHALHAIATNPWRSAMPLLLGTHEIQRGFTSRKYTEFFSAVSHDILDERIEICGVVTDNLAAQIKGLNNWIRDSDNRLVKAVIPVRCLAHSINLAFTATERTNCYLRDLTSEISDVVKLLRTPAGREALGRRCPSIVPTRWIYIVDVLKFFVDNRNDINLWLQQKQLAVTGSMISLYHITLPARLLIMALESKSSSLCNVIPHYREFIVLMEEVYKEDHVSENKQMADMFKDILVRTMARICVSAHDAIITSYLLTVGGRDEQRRMNEGVLTEGSDLFTLKWKCPSIRGARSSYQLSTQRVYDLPEVYGATEEQGEEDGTRREEGGLKEEESEEEDVEEEECEEEGELGEADHQPSSRKATTAEWLSTANYQQVEGFLATKSVDELFSYDIFPDIYETGLATLQRYAGLLHPDLSPEDVRERLNNFLFGDPAGTGLMHLFNKTPDLLWRNAHVIDRWRKFSELAMHFVTLPCTEADVERLLSAQKDATGIHTTNVTAETVEARLRTRETGHNL